jgi:membrane-bound hydrogenase subunit beta
MNETPHLSPQEIIDLYKSEFGEGIHDARITERGEGVLKTKSYNIWIRVDRALLRPAIKKLMDIRFPHFAVIAGNDLGDEIELLYILSVFYGTKFGEYMITFGIRLPKADLTVPTITDLIPGALISEREKQEFFGITVTGIPDGRRLFLPDDFPQGVYPWRKDETGIKPEMVRELWAIDRPKDRPVPPVQEKKPVQDEPAAEGMKEKTGGATK